MKRVLIVLICCLAVVNVYAQKVNPLERLVTIAFNEMPVREVFNNIGKQNGVVFSYSADFNDQRRVSGSYKNNPLRIVLADLLAGTECNYKVHGRYIIVQCGKPKPSESSVISGYIFNVRDSSAVSEASVYIKQNRITSVSNKHGYFTLTLNDQSPGISLTVAKESFKDTTIIIRSFTKPQVVVYLYPKPVMHPIALRTGSVNTLLAKDTVAPEMEYLKLHEPGLASLIWNKIRRKNAYLRNVSDTIFSKYSVSLVPGVGTNNLLSANTVSNVSFNILSGYSKGVNIAEIGGVANFDNGNVKSFQLAGVLNVVSGNVEGVQIAGVTNVVMHNFNGFQLAGVTNINSGGLKGMQLCGVANYCKQLSGVQMAGVYNQTGTAKGLQLSGIVNLADTICGLQIAGVVNKAGVNNGMQLSGIVNRTDINYGRMFALLNFADSSLGTPIGLFSYVKKGYHKLELSADEVGFVNLSFGTGVNKFHNLFIAGCNAFNPSVITYGYGIGYTRVVNKLWGLTTDLEARQILGLTESFNGVNGLIRLYTGVELRPVKGFRLGVGPTLNYLDYYSFNTSNVGAFQPVIFGNTYAGKKPLFWVGIKVAFKFF